MVEKQTDISLLILNRSEYRTPRKLLDMGIRLCSQCGHMLQHFPQTTWCIHCKDDVLVIADDMHPPFFVEPKGLTRKWGKVKPLKIHRDYLCTCGRSKQYSRSKTCATCRGNKRTP